MRPCYTLAPAACNARVCSLSGMHPAAGYGTTDIADVAGGAEVRRVQALPPAEQVGALLRTTGWGGGAGLVNAQVQRFLAEVYVSLQAPRCMYSPGSAG
jgi:hypothetical protein